MLFRFSFGNHLKQKIACKNGMELTDSNPVLGQVKDMKDLVAYQDGAVVSRTIVNTNAGTVTAFAFDQGQGLSEHTAAYDAMVIVIEGKVDIRISGSVFHLKEDQIIIMPANKPHAVKAVTRFKMLLVMIRSKRSAGKK